MTTYQEVLSRETVGRSQADASHEVGAHDVRDSAALERLHGQAVVRAPVLLDAGSAGPLTIVELTYQAARDRDVLCAGIDVVGSADHRRSSAQAYDQRAMLEGRQHRHIWLSVAAVTMTHAPGRNPDTTA